jgi:hypothetical protein
MLDDGVSNNIYFQVQLGQQYNRGISGGKLLSKKDPQMDNIRH